jgi:hypothetical protein
MTTPTIKLADAAAAANITGARQRYNMLLTTLRLETDRTEHAMILTAMAEVARYLARRTRGVTPENDTVHGDTLAWEDTAALVTRLSLAEAGVPVDIEAANDDDDTDVHDYYSYAAWVQLAKAVTGSEHLEATREVSDVLLAANANGTPQTREFAYARFLEAAVACRATYPATYPDAASYLARQAGAAS